MSVTFLLRARKAHTRARSYSVRVAFSRNLSGQSTGAAKVERGASLAPTSPAAPGVEAVSATGSQLFVIGRAEDAPRARSALRGLVLGLVAAEGEEPLAAATASVVDVATAWGHLVQSGASGAPLARARARNGRRAGAFPSVMSLAAEIEAACRDSVSVRCSAVVGGCVLQCFTRLDAGIGRKAPQKAWRD